MKKHIALFSLMASLFLVSFTTNKTDQNNTNTQTTLNEAFKIGGAYLTFAGEFGGEVSLKKMSTTNKLGVAGCASGSLVTQFTLKVKSKNKKAQTLKGTSHLLNKQMKSVLKEMKIGDTFEFSNVKAQLPTGKTVNVLCRSFKVIP
ncbi:hypothetical protein D7030_02650 [Flavobacteriaceae bacterium AU392]|nr:hypothetical protein D1817_09125 [Flavobacteriaceae bacterium]RKM85590.1 hypothetical protein D7030_02650 [Flavobacteriaceae bacterium AU392]